MPSPRFQPPLGPPKCSHRDSVLTAWRGVDLNPLEKIRDRPARPADSVLKSVLAGLRMDQRQGEAEIVRVWNGVLDPTLTAHARPTGIRNGTLFVTVDSSTWLSEIVRYRRREILERLQHAFGKEKITRISFRHG